MPEQEIPDTVTLERIARELKMMREMMTKIIFYISEAEAEVPEKIRRFMNYMHDLHDIKYMYEELGHTVPVHQLREMERCDDRFRQLMVEQNAEGGTFNKVRRDMASDPDNKWDHTRLLTKPKETVNEPVRTGVQNGTGGEKGGT